MKQSHIFQSRQIKYLLTWLLLVPASVCQATELLDLGYNKLEVDTADSCVDTADPDWKDTQTVPPTSVTVATTSATDIELTWDAIAYTQDGGYYGMWGKMQGTPTYTLMVTTADKTSTDALVSGLQSGTTYELVIRTFTPAHGDQQNDLTSVDSGVVTAVTTEFFTRYLPVISNPTSFGTVAINDGPIPTRPVAEIGEVFYATTINISADLPSGGTFYLSSGPDVPVAAAVDDEVAILLDGSELFTYSYGQPGLGVTPALVEVPRRS